MLGTGEPGAVEAGEWEGLMASLEDRAGSGSKRRRRHAPRQLRLRRWWRRHRLLISTSATVVLVLVLGGLEALESFTRIELPPLVHQPLVPILLTLLILFFALQSYRQSLHSQAFYRRFVRPGLRRLVEVDGELMSRGEKLFRPRQALVMKIDVEGYTFLTYDMPYGMRRLFLDLWYTLVDDVLARDIFFDKSLGDGSIYVFDATSREGACRTALAAALRVRDETVPRFDRIFRERLAAKIEQSPGLRVPSELYFERYRERAGGDFWKRPTAVRIALAAGCVDEGLWGLPKQSHYDVQGTALVVASRLEQAAASGEILLDRSFAAALESELGPTGMPRGLEERRIDIRGMGELRVWVFPSIVPATPSDDGAVTTSATAGSRRWPLCPPDDEAESDLEARSLIGL